MSQNLKSKTKICQFSIPAGTRYFKSNARKELVAERMKFIGEVYV